MAPKFGTSGFGRPQAKANSLRETAAARLIEEVTRDDRLQDVPKTSSQGFGSDLQLEATNHSAEDALMRDGLTALREGLQL
ncbi:MAG: hypothetical protein WBB25_00270 [Sulfitobacter sp.]